MRIVLPQHVEGPTGEGPVWARTIGKLNWSGPNETQRERKSDDSKAKVGLVEGASRGQSTKFKHELDENVEEVAKSGWMSEQ